jgi:hypothetical protein
MTSRKLNLAEKTDVLTRIRFVVQTEYVSTAQREQILEEIAQLQMVAEQKFREQHYVEVFILLTKAEEKADDIFLLGRLADSLSKQSVQSIKSFVQVDESPLMKLLKNPEISVTEKQNLLAELKAPAKHSQTATDRIFIGGKEYNGTLAQIISSPNVDWGIKILILGNIESIVEEQAVEEIAPLRILVEQQLKEQHYVEAFLLFSEAVEKKADNPLAAISLLTSGDPLGNQIFQSIQFFVQSDESPLMELLKDPNISVAEKQNILSELRVLANHSQTATDKVLVQGKEYDGPLVQITSNPDVNVAIKLVILVHIEQMMHLEEMMRIEEIIEN